MKKLISLTVLALVMTTGVWAQQMNVSVSKETNKSSQSEIIATTPFVCGESKVADYDGNSYNTVQIGKQCWMKENLKTTHYSDGTPIEATTDMNFDSYYRYSPNLNPNLVVTYGFLYNWTAVTRDKYATSALNPSGIQGICPTGWHVPSDDEWTELTDYLSGNSQYTCDTKSQYLSLEMTKKYIAKALAAQTGWRSCGNKCAIGCKLEENDASGFSALPAGQYTGFENFDNFSEIASFWTCTRQDNVAAFYRTLRFNEEFVSGIGGIDGSGYTSKKNGLSVRCVKD